MTGEKRRPSMWASQFLQALCHACGMSFSSCVAPEKADSAVFHVSASDPFSVGMRAVGSSIPGTDAERE